MKLIKYFFLAFSMGVCNFKLFAVDYELTDYQSFTQHGDHRYDVQLPIQANLTEQLFLEVELGCAQQGCSDWDYTIRFEWIKEGQKYELGRLITPYAGYMQRGMHGFDRNWRRKYEFDVSHLAPVLQGEGVINAHYGGWGAKKSAFGFSAKLITRGVVSKQVRRVIPIYYSQPAGWPYKTAAEFAQYLPAVDVPLLDNEIHAELKVIVSAHGHALSFDNPENRPELCGEWCERYIDIKQNGLLLERTALWRTDCDKSATFPQGGTYIFSRANWCPGEVVEPFNYIIDTQHTNTRLDIDWQAYSWQPSDYGKGAPRYIVSAVLVTYGPVQRNTDLALEQIVTPNNSIASRNSESCGEIEVAVKNQGHTEIEHIHFTYGVIGKRQYSYVWQGGLLPGERRVIKLPAQYWGVFSKAHADLFVEAKTAHDESSVNNRVYSQFDLPIALTQKAQLFLTSGKQPEETSVQIKDRDGHLVKQWQQFSASTEHVLDLDMPVGCYRIEINDSAHDGLAFPFLNARKGRGSITIVDYHSAKELTHEYPLQADFGRQLSTIVTIGYELGGCAASAWEPHKAYAQMGEHVGYKGVIYEAKHWSYNFQPDKAGPYDAWHAVSYCDGSALSL